MQLSHDDASKDEPKIESKVFNYFLTATTLFWNKNSFIKIPMFLISHLIQVHTICGMASVTEFFEKFPI